MSYHDSSLDGAVALLLLALFLSLLFTFLFGLAYLLLKFLTFISSFF